MKLTKKINWIMIGVAIGVWLCVVILLSVRVINKSPNLSGTINYTIEFQNLTEKQIKYSEQFLSEINPDYLSKVNKIVFTKDLPYCPDCYGLNYPNSKTVYVNWNYSKQKVKESLCHELLHFFIPVEHSEDYSEPEHRIVKDMSERGICYE